MIERSVAENNVLLHLLLHNQKKLMQEKSTERQRSNEVWQSDSDDAGKDSYGQIIKETSLIGTDSEILETPLVEYSSDTPQIMVDYIPPTD